MRPHATLQAKRLATLAANTTNPRKRKRLRMHAERWRAMSLESDSERDARQGREMRQAAERSAALNAKRLLQQIAKAECIARWQARPPKPRSRADREVILLKKSTHIGMHVGKQEIRRLRQELRAERQRQREAVAEMKRAAKRAAARLPPLPY